MMENRQELSFEELGLKRDAQPLEVEKVAPEEQPAAQELPQVEQHPNPTSEAPEVPETPAAEVLLAPVAPIQQQPSAIETPATPIPVTMDPEDEGEVAIKFYTTANTTYSQPTDENLHELSLVARGVAKPETIETQASPQ